MKILYLYDVKGWAIYNLGISWFNEIKDCKIVLKNYKEVDLGYFKKFDYVWFGCSKIYRRFRHNQVKSIVSVLDPIEAFETKYNWRTSAISKEALILFKKLNKIVVMSREMKEMLFNYGIKANYIPTRSILPLRRKNAIFTKKVSFLSVYNNHYRKNVELMDKINSFIINKLNMEFYRKSGINKNKILSKNNYLKLLDEHEVYICTSYQEGGPMPAMDAMHRGEVVVTTPVGQMPEIIKNGENGFLCKNEKEFRNVISMLAKDKKLLHKIRLDSRKKILKKRSKKYISESVQNYINQIK